MESLRSATASLVFFYVFYVYGGSETIIVAKFIVASIGAIVFTSLISWLTSLLRRGSGQVD